MHSSLFVPSAASEADQKPEQPSPLTRRMEEFFADQRQIMLWGPVTDDSARHIVERLLFLNGQNSDQAITILVHSPGGSTAAGMAILDAMDWVNAPIATVCLGVALSFGAVVLACGTPGMRRAAPRSRVMIHQPWVNGRIEGRPVEVLRHAREIQNTRDEINRVLALRTGQPLERVEADTDRDFWLGAEEAREYGLVDEVLRFDEVPRP